MVCSMYLVSVWVVLNQAVKVVDSFSQFSQACVFPWNICNSPWGPPISNIYGARYKSGLNQWSGFHCLRICSFLFFLGHKLRADVFSVLLFINLLCIAYVPVLYIIIAWNTYLLSHFNATPPPKPPDALNRNPRHIDARASAVPLGRGRISQGMNRTADAFDCPSLAVMTCLVSKFWVRWLPFLHLVLKNSQLLIWSTLTQVMRKIEMWLSLTWPTSFTLLWVRNVFLLVGKKPRSPPFTKRL